MLKVFLTLSFATSFAGVTPVYQPVGNQAAPVAAVAVPLSSAIQYKTYKQWKSEQHQYWNSKGNAQTGHDLTVADYFAGYVMKQKNQAEAIKQVSNRLSPDEIAELMTVYAHSVFGTQAPGLPARADNSAK